MITNIDPGADCIRNFGGVFFQGASKNADQKKRSKKGNRRFKIVVLTKTKKKVMMEGPRVILPTSLYGQSALV
jgi:hypothetical protein